MGDLEQWKVLISHNVTNRAGCEKGHRPLNCREPTGIDVGECGPRAERSRLGCIGISETEGISRTRTRKKWIR